MSSLSEVSTLLYSQPNLFSERLQLSFDRLQASPDTLALENPDEVIPTIVVVGNNNTNSITLTFFEVRDRGVAGKYRYKISSNTGEGSFIVNEFTRDRLSLLIHVPPGERDADGGSDSLITLSKGLA